MRDHMIPVTFSSFNADCSPADDSRIIFPFSLVCTHTPPFFSECLRPQYSSRLLSVPCSLSLSSSSLDPCHIFTHLLLPSYGVPKSASHSTPPSHVCLAPLEAGRTRPGPSSSLHATPMHCCVNATPNTYTIHLSTPKWGGGRRTAPSPTPHPSLPLMSLSPHTYVQNCPPCPSNPAIARTS